mmetsp:Transcript_9991/g.23650  ORF Transcript_9991/g.23650 Transcript_9991/m.23650 type:complete len:223 (+) Transcript_9991:380-1048(+)
MQEVVLAFPCGHVKLFRLEVVLKVGVILVLLVVQNFLVPDLHMDAVLHGAPMMKPRRGCFEFQSSSRNSSSIRISPSADIKDVAGAVGPSESKLLEQARRFRACLLFVVAAFDIGRRGLWYRILVVSGTAVDQKSTRVAETVGALDDGTRRTCGGRGCNFHAVPFVATSTPRAPEGGEVAATAARRHGRAAPAQPSLLLDLQHVGAADRMDHCTRRIATTTM